MNILICSSEVAPYAKTGGLADVCGALPSALADLGAHPIVVMPAFLQHMRKAGVTAEPNGMQFEVPIGSRLVAGRVLESRLPDSQVPVYFIDQPQYFDRPELYRERGEDYRDNCERYVFFCRAVMDAVQLLGLQPQILHCNDWQTGLIPAYLQIEYRHARGYEEAATIFTIHNMVYQGQFWHWDMLLTGLDWRYFNWHQMEFFGQLNLLKTGIVFADAITTVSPTYATEIQSAPQGAGLEGVLQQRRSHLSGIVNGVDYSVWNPAHDEHLQQGYTVENWEAGKAANKAALQDDFGLPRAPHTPVLGFVGRLADQKGLDLLCELLPKWAATEDVQWVFLGTGEPRYHELLTRAAREWPSKVGVKLEFSDRLAHRVEAGADLFLMPSAYEPCGLNQLYSLKYGTVPLVRYTGGLADTICDATDRSLHEGTANGFCFYAYDAHDLENTLRRACDIYRHRWEIWRQLVTTGMQQDWSWSESARQYLSLYHATQQRKLGTRLHSPAH